MVVITSRENTKIKELNKLHQRKYRKKAQAYLIEGFHLVEEAYLAHKGIEEVFVTEKFLTTAPTWVTELTYFIVTPEVLGSISQLPTPQGIIAKVTLEKVPLPKVLTGGYLLLDEVQDPGNVGTMIRNADAFGLAGVVLGTGSADWQQGKVLRALQGSQYHLPIYEGDLKEWVDLAKTQGIPVFGTALDKKAVALPEVKPVKNFLVILGNEGQGVKEDYLKETNQNIYIPMKGQAESLNVGVASGIVLYHLTQN